MKTAVCCICRNENRYLREWVEWYKKLGFDNIILYDNVDNAWPCDNVDDVIHDYIVDEFVIRIDVPTLLASLERKTTAKRMFICYNDCIMRFGREYDWIAFFDVDEFLCFTKAHSINEYLSMFREDTDCILINQMNMDDNDLLEYDGRPLMERFTRAIPKYKYNNIYNKVENSHAKAILKCTPTNIARAFFHYPHYADNCKNYVNADGNLLLHKENNVEVYWDNAYIKHFKTKTISEFLENKVLRGYPDISFHQSRIHNNLDKTFFNLNKRTPEKDRIAEEFFKANKDLIDRRLNEETEGVDMFVMTHKKIAYSIPGNFKLMQCGAASSEEKISEYTDDTGDNISLKNKYYSEVTGIYWLWKNSNAEVKGQIQYRRFINMDDWYDVKSMLRNFDIIVPTPYNFGPNYTVEQQYGDCLDPHDLIVVQDILSRLYPEYVDSYERHIKHGHILFYGNSFVTKRAIYDDLCEFCFGVMAEFDKVTHYDDEKTSYEHAKYVVDNLNTTSSIKDQMRLQGHLFERIVTLYIMHNYEKLAIYNTGPFVLKENGMKG